MRVAGQLVALSDLRPFRARDSPLDGLRLVRAGHQAASAHARAHASLRVRRLPGAAGAEPLHDQLLPDGDALHRLRHRDRLPVSARRDPPRAGVVRLRGVPLLRRHPRARLRLHLAQGSARLAMSDKKRLADYGLKSERVQWVGKGPGVFEQELGNLENELMLTTVEKAVAWSQSSSIWPDTF